jgi:hypothetical protein
MKFTSTRLYAASAGEFFTERLKAIIGAWWC